MVKEILKEAKKSLPQNNILIDDLNKQENDFQKKLQEKRSKRVISWNDQHDFIEEVFIILYRCLKMKLKIFR